MKKLKKVDHVALRCRDARETHRFYTEVLGLELAAAVGGDLVPSTKEFSPHLNLFLELADGTMLDFIDVPLSDPAQKDPNTPEWVQHLALKVDTESDLLEFKRRIEADGREVIGPVDHGRVSSIYFFDPSSHRIEILWSYAPDYHAGRRETARTMLDQWEAKKARGWSIPESAAPPR
jgi:glyoxylase I family protein